MGQHQLLYTTEVTCFSLLDELDKQVVQLLEMAEKAAEKAHAPYSLFQVGAALLLSNGQIITGNNQENVAYPSGLCAERTAAFYAHAQFPDAHIKILAIRAFSKKFIVDKPVYPCGSCRQALIEFEQLAPEPMLIYMMGAHGEIHLVKSIGQLLPSFFKADALRHS